MYSHHILFCLLDVIIVDNSDIGDNCHYGPGWSSIRELVAAAVAYSQSHCFPEPPVYILMLGGKYANMMTMRMAVRGCNPQRENEGPIVDNEILSDECDSTVMSETIHNTGRR
ncbi:unnamed protein product [Macrosiphum euphorbiae]|uniref:Uncharacterized protein n=1 Tax=Macrosiphum euphorbiae TaxID=13131 RepID=A0AAV0VXZ1_9HEMI|nr:unnamed protein product [Macrosiphum euphorbiae]